MSNEKSSITTKFADFKADKIKKFKKTKEFDPLSDDIIALQELENGDIEKIEGPVEIVKVTGIITDPEKIKKLEETIQGGPTFTTDLQVKNEVKRGMIIWVTAFIQKSGSSISWSSQQSAAVLKCRIVDIYTGYNKLKYI
jgi:hypothetical protein